MNIHTGIEELIGNTPMVYLDRFCADCPARVAAKLEMFNPYSVKDRPVLKMIEEGEREGLVNSGTTIIEATSGNTGLALAFLCAIRGYRLIICMSEIQTEERKRLLRAFGAHLELTPAALGTIGAKERAMELRDTMENSFYIEQHSNPNNALAHRTTGDELWEDTDGKIDILVAGLGTSGTLMGCYDSIKPRKVSFVTVGVEPEISPTISKGIFRPHRQAGTSPGFVPKLLDRNKIDIIETVNEEDSFETCRELALREGILAGITSGMSAHVARKMAMKEENRGKLIVCVFADSGQRYLSVEGLY